MSQNYDTSKSPWRSIIFIYFIGHNCCRCCTRDIKSFTKNQQKHRPGCCFVLTRWCGGTCLWGVACHARAGFCLMLRWLWHGKKKDAPPKEKELESLSWNSFKLLDLKYPFEAGECSHRNSFRCVFKKSNSPNAHLCWKRVPSGPSPVSIGGCCFGASFWWLCVAHLHLSSSAVVCPMASFTKTST